MVISTGTEELYVESKEHSQTRLPLAAVTTLLYGLVYLGIQQSLRQGANDPQIQIMVWLVTLAVALIVVAGCELIFADRKHTV